MRKRKLRKLRSLRKLRTNFVNHSPLTTNHSPARSAILRQPRSTLIVNHSPITWPSGHPLTRALALSCSLLPSWRFTALRARQCFRCHAVALRACLHAFVRQPRSTLISKRSTKPKAPLTPHLRLCRLPAACCLRGGSPPFVHDSVFVATQWHFVQLAASSHHSPITYNLAVRPSTNLSPVRSAFVHR